MALFISMLLTAVFAAQEAALRIRFTPESEKFDAATAEYERLWAAEGSRIVAAMERISGLKQQEREISAVVFEGPSYSGYRERPMRLRASYPEDVKKATLVHELYHRFLTDVRTTTEIDEHRKVFLVLYDTWVALYGAAFADEMVKVERGRKGIYDYDTAWTWALAMTPEQRAARFKELLR